MGWCYDFNSTIKCGNIPLPYLGTSPDITDLVIVVLIFLVNILSLTVATVGDGSICYVIAMQQQCRTPSNIILASLALTDFLVGVLVQPLSLFVALVSLTAGRYYCFMVFSLHFLSLTCIGASVWTLLVMTLER